MGSGKWLLLALCVPLAACGGASRDDGNAPPGERRGVLGFFLNDGPDIRDTVAPLAPQVISVSVDRTPGGVILNTVGLPPRQGYWEAELVPTPSEDARILAFEFRLRPPLEPTRVSTQRSREVVAGIFLTDQTLAGVREIRVVSASNSIGRRLR